MTFNMDIGTFIVACIGSFIAWRQLSKINKQIEIAVNNQKLDRLCYCIDKGYIEDKDWRSEYRNLIHEIIKNYEEDFGEASPYNNIKKINRKWQNL